MNCPVGHTKTQKVGVVMTRKGPQQRFKCTTCGRTFYHRVAPAKVAPKPAPKPKAAKKRSHKAKK